MIASIRCKTQKHWNEFAKTNTVWCDGFAYPGTLQADPVPCECGCHREDEKEPDENPT